MEKKFFLILLISAILILAFSPNALAAWKLEKMTSELEKKLSIAEKQAEILIKMLNSEKYLERLQKDINKFGERNAVYNLEAKGTYLYKVFKKLNVPLEKSAIISGLLTGDRYSMYIQMLSPGLVFGISNGVFNGGNRFAKAEDKEFYEIKANTQKLAAICRKLIAIQKPVQLLAREKLNIDPKILRDFSNIAGGCPSKKSVKGREPRASYLYSFLIPQNRVPYLTSRVKFYLQADSTYLIYYKEFLKYLEEIGYGFDGGRGDWQEVIDRVDKAIADKAEVEDLGDFDTKNEGKTKDGDSDEGLNLDDLKLPSK